QAAEAALAKKAAEAGTIQQSLDQRTQKIEAETRKQQEARTQSERACAEQQAKLDALSKQLEAQQSQLKDRAAACEKESERLRAVSRQCEEQNSQQDKQGAELSVREQDLVDRERTVSEAQAAAKVRECKLQESLQQLENERTQQKALTEQLEA